MEVAFLAMRRASNLEVDADASRSQQGQGALDIQLRLAISEQGTELHGLERAGRR